MSLELDLGAIVGTVVLDDVIFQRTYVRVVRQMADLGLEAERSGGQTLVLDRGLDGVGRSSDLAATRLARASAAMREAGLSASQVAVEAKALGGESNALTAAQLRLVAAEERLTAVQADTSASAGKLASAQAAVLSASDRVIAVQARQVASVAAIDAAMQRQADVAAHAAAVQAAATAKAAAAQTASAEKAAAAQTASAEKAAAAQTAAAAREATAAQRAAVAERDHAAAVAQVAAITGRATDTTTELGLAQSKLTQATLQQAAAQARLTVLEESGKATTGQLATAQAALGAANDRVTLSQERVTAAQGRGARMGEAIKKTWGEIPTVVKAGTLALVVAAAASVHAASEYQKTTVNLVTGAGEQQANLSMVSKGMLEMAGDVGDSAQELSKAMFTVESAGYHGAAALTVLRTAAEGAKVDNADLTTVVDALTSALNAYDLPASQAARVTNELIAAASVGKMHLQDLASALGTVLPSAAALHVPLDQVGAALATMTMQGTNAQQAATYLRFALAAIANPSEKAQKAMASVGLTSEQVADTLTHGGLPAVLHLLTDAVGRQFPVGSAKYVAALANMVGGTRGMQAVLELTGAHLQTMDDNLAAIQLRTELAGNEVSEWDQVQKNFNVTLSKFLDRIEANGIALGQHLLPVVTELFKVLNGGLHVLGAVTGFLADNKTAALALATVVTLALLPGITRLTTSLMTSAWGFAVKGLQAIGAAAAATAVEEGEAAAATNSLSAAGSRLAKGGLIVGTLYGIYQGAKALGDVFQKNTTPSVNQFTAALLKMHETGSFDSLKPLLTAAVELSKIDFGAAVKSLTNLDQSLADMVDEGHIQLAKEEYDQLKKMLESAGWSAKQVAKAFPLLDDALLQNRNNAKLDADGLDDLGASADQAGASVEAAAQKMFQAAVQTQAEQVTASENLATFYKQLKAAGDLSYFVANVTPTAVSKTKAMGMALVTVAAAIEKATDPAITSLKELRALSLTADRTNFSAIISKNDAANAKAYADALREVAQRSSAAAQKARDLASAMPTVTAADKAAKKSAEETVRTLTDRAHADSAAATAAESASTREQRAYQLAAAAAEKATQRSVAAAQALVTNLKSSSDALLQEVSSFSSQISSGLTGGSDLTTIWQSLVGTDADGNPTSPTLAQVEASLNKTLANVKSFSADLTALTKAGASQDLITQLLGMGDVNGDALAKQLLAAGATTIQSFSSIYAQIDSLTDKEEHRLSKSFYGAGVDSMVNLLKGIVHQFPALRKGLAPIIAELQKAFTIIPVIGDPVKGAQSSTLVKNGSSMVGGGHGGVKTKAPVVVKFPGGGGSQLSVLGSAARGGDGASMVDILQAIASSNDRIERQLVVAPEATGKAVGDASLELFKAAGKEQADKTSRARRNNR